MRPLIRLFNELRNRVGRGLLGQLLRQVSRRGEPHRIRVVSATRLEEAAFWKSSALGQSLGIRRTDPRVIADVAYANKAGLPAVYNAALGRAARDEAVVFVHDDVWLDDPQWVEKVLAGLRRYDVIGLAGNRRRVPRQPAWLYLDVQESHSLLDAANLSGAVAHGKQARGEMSYFGPSPASCELLDGLFIASRADLLHRWKVHFDERFEFHFYDLDFCRGARASGLSIGTWPILVTHQSTGAFKSPAWRAGRDLYLDKWRS